MKIVFLADASNSHAKKWTTFFADKGHDVHIISFLDAELPGVTVHHIQLLWSGVINHSFSTMATVKKLIYLLYAKQIKKLVHELSPDILHAHYATSYGILGALSGFHPFFISVWGSDILDFPKKSKIRANIIKWILSKADHITATSQMLFDETRLYVSKEKRISIIPFGVDIKRFSPVNSKMKNGVTIGVAKLLEKKYGLEYLIMAFAECLKCNENIHLSIAGDGSQMQNLQELCKELNITSFVTFHGHVDNLKVHEHFQALDIFVMPSVMDSETFGVAAVEASACGVPVVASRIGGVPEVVQDGVTGFLVEPKNVTQLAEKMQILIKDAALRGKMGKAGREFVTERYDWDKNANMMLALYNNVNIT